MLHQSKIRKAALCLIYALLEQKTSQENFDYAIFWQLALSKEIDQQRLAKAKAVIHLCRALGDPGALLQQRGDSLLSAASCDAQLLHESNDVRHLLTTTSSLLEALGTLQRNLVDKRREGTDTLEKDTQSVLRCGDAFLAQASVLEPALSQLPAGRGESFCGVLRRMQRILQEVSSLKKPEEMDEAGELSGLVKKTRELTEFRPAAQQLAVEAYSHRDEWEQCLSLLLRNYVPDRLANVDKAILYLSLHELKYNGLDVRIVVSEATNLAHTFSGSKSAPFVHGIIATAAAHGAGSELSEPAYDMTEEEESQHS